MRICLVTAWGFQHLDGSNLRTYFLLMELLKRKHNITVIHASASDAEYTKETFNCESIGAGIEISRWDTHRQKLIKYIKFINSAKKILKTMDFDVVFGISLLNSLVISGQKRSKSIAMYVDFMSNYYSFVHETGLPHKLFARFLRFLERYTIKKADRVIVITNAMKKLVPVSCRDKVCVIPDGADTVKFIPRNIKNEAKKIFGLTSDNFVIGYQGGIEKFDGLQFLAEIAPELVKNIPGVRFLIAGRGSYLETVKEIVDKNKTTDNFIFLGWVASEKVPDVMAATDLNVVPVPNHPCTAPLITFRLVESMAAGVNVIVNDLPGMREIVDESMVFFTDVQNPAKFAEDIIKVYKTPAEKRLAMIKNARNKIETLDWRKIAGLDADKVEMR
ncbi:MAG: glycosyltransferase family 4 protein [Elusimicrobia bacterium]|nr:glycosyltransferase family 4 protein [Candidatus Liberimonas magnetica]